MSRSNDYFPEVGGVQEVKLRGDFSAQQEWGAVTQLFSPLGVDEKKIILADRWDDQGIGGFYIASVVLLAVRHQLLASFVGNWHVGLNIVQTVTCIRFAPKVKVYAFVDSFTS